jgi:hypothetical protein
MKITNINSGSSYVNASIPNAFSILKIDTIDKIISIGSSTLSSLVIVTNDSAVSLAVEPDLKAAVYKVE